MLNDGLVRLSQCHALLADAPARLAKYDSLVRTNIEWFFAHLTPRTAVSGTSCYTFAYQLPSGTEDANHFAYDSEGLWIALNSGRYGLKASDILPFANTYTDVILATVNNGLFAGKVDGTSGTGHAAGDNYVRDEYYYYTEFRPDKYAFMAGIDISRNKAHSSPPITARILWEKNRRYLRGL